MFGRFRITNPTLARVSNNGHHEAITIPTGSIIDLDGKKFNGDRLMDVVWGHRLVLMFTEDLRASTLAV